ncbi:hypothetical protein MOF27_04895 [Priestia megaterium]|jgi:hypothetical protein|uniref:hypothetical protein n=1 Tax=Priestia megaterium TaxID=1404 RepID=UPI0022810F26|nr:hypothetical protein [Priestia megaterium]MCY9016764.1 hypothetical protein [Priestia megaterium]
MEEFKDLLSYGILMRPTSYSKLKLAIEELTSEERFRDLYKVPSYNTVIWKNKKIKKILLDSQKVKKIKKNQQHSMKFINLVKELAK